MVEIRPSKSGEVDAQKALWSAAFGDDTRYIDWFYQSCWHPEHMLLLLEDGALVSMVALLPQELTLTHGVRAKAFYVYALATDPSARGKGYGRHLLHHADQYLRDRGADCVTVVPAQPSLFKFFGTVDFVSAFFTRKVELLREQVKAPKVGDWVEPVSPAVYNAIRSCLLSDTPSILYGEELIRYQQGMGELSGGGLYRVVANGAEGCAAVEYVNEESVLFKELLIPPEHMHDAVAAFSQILHGRRCHVRTPAVWAGLPGSYIQPFGMLKWYRPEMSRLWGEDRKGYMGLGFD